MKKKFYAGILLSAIVLLGGGCFGKAPTAPAPREEVREEIEEEVPPAPVVDQVVRAYDLIEVTNPLENQAVESPLLVTGRARGTWYFEATFPIEIRDANGVLLGQHYAEAQSNWMTEEYVEFRSMLTFDEPTTATGTLILKKDNPSGLPEHDKQLEIPVRFE